MGYIKKLYDQSLVGATGTSEHEVYPVTSTLAVYDQTGQNNLDTQLTDINTTLGSKADCSLQATQQISLTVDDIRQAGGVLVSVGTHSSPVRKTISSATYLINIINGTSTPRPIDEKDKISIIRLNSIGDSTERFTLNSVNSTYFINIEATRPLIYVTSLNGVSLSPFTTEEQPMLEDELPIINMVTTAGGTISGDVTFDSDCTVRAYGNSYFYDDVDIQANLHVAEELTVGNSEDLGRIRNIANPINDTDVANKQYVDSHHDSTKQDTLTFDDAPTAESDNPVKSSGIKTYVDGSQYPVAIVRDALTNINGRTFQHYEATLSTITIDNVQYTIYTITSDGNQLTESSARTYMKYMCGTEFLPVYDYDFPKNPFFVFADQSIWKPQYDSTYGLRLFKIGDDLATKQYVDDHVSVYWATYGTTTNAQIRAAFNAGKIIACKRVMDGQTYYLTALGDREQDTRFVCIDSRDPKYISWLGIDALTGEWYEGYAQYQQYALVTSLSSASDNSHYPSAKAVYDLVKAVVELNRLDMPS